MPWDFALILLVLGAVVPWRGAARVRELLARPDLDTADRLAVYGSTIAFQWTAVLVVAWRCAARGITARQLGLAFVQPALTVTITLALTVLLAGIQLLSLRRLARLAPERQGFLPRLAQKLFPRTLPESAVFAALAATVALCEEFLYRGFVFATLERAVPQSLIPALLGSSMLFALAHAYQGRRGMVTTFTVGLVFALARIQAQSLAPAIVAHFFTDLVAGLGAQRFLKPQGAAANHPPQGPGEKEHFPKV